MEPSPDPTFVEEPRPLGFADGLQFGCGFFLAAALAGLLSLLSLAVVGFILSLLGVGALQDLLSLAVSVLATSVS